MPRHRLTLPAIVSFVLALAGLAWQWLNAPAPLADGPLAHCLGASRPLQIVNQMPYVDVTVDGRPGHFVIDFGADVSAITPAGFTGMPPQPMPGTGDRYARFDFFGPWSRVQLHPQPQAPVSGGVPQAGVIGTNFLGQHVITLDYPGRQVYRAAPRAFCGDGVLREAGFRALDSSGYYAADTATLRCPNAGMPGRCPNIPVLPVRVGTVRAVAQIDTGFDDGRVPHSMNINVAFLHALQAAGIRLEARPDIALTLSTCQAGVTERVEAWRLPDGLALEFVGMDGSTVRRFTDATLFVKRPPPAARVCGGIGVWPQPAAQLGASFFAEDALIVDPQTSRVWLRPNTQTTKSPA